METRFNHKSARRTAVALIATCLVIATSYTLKSQAGSTDDDELQEKVFEAVLMDPNDDLLTTVERRPYNPNYDNRTFGVIVDCGSSGTRAHLYVWDGTLPLQKILHDIEPMRDSDEKPISKKFQPSLASFADQPKEKLNAYIRQIMDYIDDHVPVKSRPFTGVYLMATAGMRLLNDEEQMRIINEAKSYIEDNYNFARVRVDVISGAQEGMYQWISVNAKAKRFLGQNTNGRTKTFGIIEMGGASLQIAYQLRPGVPELTTQLIHRERARKVYKAQIIEPKLSRKDKPENTYVLHSTTFLGFGSNSIREAYLDLLIHEHRASSGWQKLLDWTKRLISFFDPRDEQKDQEAANNQVQMVLNDPCLPKGFETTLKKPQRTLEGSGKVLGYILDDGEPDLKYHVRGTGHYGKCKRTVERLLNLAKRERLNCKPKEASKCTMELIGETFLPFDSVDFLGIGDVFYTTNLMLRASGIYDHNRIVARTKKICQMTFAELQEKYPDLANNRYLKSRLSDECFKAVWLDTFLVRGLNYPKDMRTLRTVGHIANDPLEWTLGAVLDKSLSIEEAADEKAVQMFGPNNKRVDTMVQQELDDQDSGEDDDELYFEPEPSYWYKVMP